MSSRPFCKMSSVNRYAAAVHLHAGDLLVPMNPCLKIRNDSPSRLMHLAHSKKLCSFTYVTHPLLWELLASNILHKSIATLCLAVCSHAAPRPLISPIDATYKPAYA
ncbi:uncharacterized protein LOC119182925 [Rhipicephalus microplus]|uniref:uncharacterized protein LOC119182925 n=1 Tax=Rhipicephalus microplus TaxID=6941 RepID=UPI003F6D452F